MAGCRTRAREGAQSKREENSGKLSRAEQGRKGEPHTFIEGTTRKDYGSGISSQIAASHSLHHSTTARTLFHSQMKMQFAPPPRPRPLSSSSSSSLSSSYMDVRPIPPSVHGRSSFCCNGNTYFAGRGPSQRPHRLYIPGQAKSKRLPCALYWLNYTTVPCR